MVKYANAKDYDGQNRCITRVIDIFGPHMIMNRLTTLFVALTIGFGTTCAQTRIQNGSFEGQPQDATIPIEWQPCEIGTTPDILPGHWGVNEEAYDGETYMGLIVREDGSYESVGQFLENPLIQGYCYEFSIYLAHSHVYAGYNLPIGLNIWGGSKVCSKDQLLGQAELVSHARWKKYVFKFIPKQDIYYFQIEARKAAGLYINYRGNILIDNCSTIKTCNRA